MEDSSRYSYDEIAQNYDEEVKAYDSFAHEAIFGMSYEFISTNDSLLDIGIGTGLASENFAKAGLRISGLDNSKEMLGVCKAKGISESLIEHDITHIPYPFAADAFNHIICCGVLHFFGDLSTFVSEVRRLLVTSGTFSFSIAPSDLESKFVRVPTEWGVPIFKHSSQFIDQLLVANSFNLLKEQRILVKGKDKKTYNMEFSVIVCKCNK